MKLHTHPWFGFALAVGCLAPSASAQVPFYDDFNGYTLGSVINGNNGWKQWDNAANASNIIEDSTSGFARSGKSVSINAFVAGDTSDLVHQFSGFTSGKSTVRAYMYAPAGTADAWGFIIMNTYADLGPYDWSVEVDFNSPAGMYTGLVGAGPVATGALITDAWVEVKAQIDLTANLVQVFYNGTAIAPAYSWTGGVFGAGGGALNVAAVDLYHFPATTTPSGKAYWDDFGLTNGFDAPTSTYCTAKITSQGCAPSISGVGFSHASLNSGPFNVTTSLARFNKPGLYIYGLNQAATPLQNGILCIGSGLKRSTGFVSGGVLAGPDCGGVYVFDFNAYAHTTPPVNAPSPLLLVPGTIFNIQCWGRDNGFAPPNNSLLSNAMTFTVGS